MIPSVPLVVSRETAEPSTVAGPLSFSMEPRGAVSRAAAPRKWLRCADVAKGREIST